MSNIKLKLFLISQDVNTRYDTYDSAVVCTTDEARAKLIHPSNYKVEPIIYPDGVDDDRWGGEYSNWCSPENVKVKYIGEAEEGLKEGTIFSSFNAG